MSGRRSLIAILMLFSLPVFSQSWHGQIQADYASTHFNNLFGSTEIVRAVMDTRFSDSEAHDGIAVAQHLHWDRKAQQFFIQIDSFAATAAQGAQTLFWFENPASRIDTMLRPLEPFNWSVRLKSNFSIKQDELLAQIAASIQPREGSTKVAGEIPAATEEIELLLTQDIYFDTRSFGMQARIVAMEWQHRGEVAKQIVFVP